MEVNITEVLCVNIFGSRCIDFHLGNLLLYSPQISAWSTQEDVEKYLGKPRKAPLKLRDACGSAPSPSPHIPAYCVPTPSHSAVISLLHLCLDDPSQVHLKICDFSESFIYDPIAPIRRPTNSPKVYRDPQTMLNNGNAIEPVCPSLSTDIWALAVLFHQLLTGWLLFPSAYRQEDIILREMVLVLGRFPEPYWSLWTNRALYFDYDGDWVGDESKLSCVSGVFLKVQDEQMDDEEMRLFEDMLRSMVIYDPDRRINADDMVATPWFVKYCMQKV